MDVWRNYHDNTIQCCDNDVCLFRSYKDILTFKKGNGIDWNWLKLARQFAGFLLNNITNSCDYSIANVDRTYQILNSSCSLGSVSEVESLKDYFEKGVSCGGCEDDNHTNNSTCSFFGQGLFPFIKLFFLNNIQVIGRIIWMFGNNSKTIPFNVVTTIYAL